MWWCVFGILTAALTVRNAFLFTTPVYEDADAADYSLSVFQAKHFTLLVGDYSRTRFYHPGPGYTYIQAAGEWLFHDVSGVVPAPFNGQVLALIILNAGLVAAVAAVCYGWLRSVPAVVALVAVILGYSASHESFLVSYWQPHVFVPSFLLLLASAASVAAGRVQHLWPAVLAGGLLMHGHVCFFLFAPVVIGAALAVVTVRHRGRFRDLFAGQRRSAAAAAGLVVLFATPLVLNLLLHWPGEFERYLEFARTANPRGNAADDVTRYMLWYWWGDASSRRVAASGWPIGPIASAVLTFAGAVLCALRFPIVSARPFVRAWLAACVLATMLTAGYAWRSIDDIHDPYMAYFFWSVPLTCLVIVTAAVIGWARRWRKQPAGIAVAAAVTLGVCLAVTRPQLTAAYRGNPYVRLASAAMAEAAHGAPILIAIHHDTWPDAFGVVLDANRLGYRACFVDPWWRIMVDSGMSCTKADYATGVWFRFHSTLPRNHDTVTGPVVAWLGPLGQSEVTVGN